MPCNHPPGVVCPECPREVANVLNSPVIRRHSETGKESPLAANAVSRIRALTRERDSAILLLQELLAKAYADNDLCPICNMGSDEGHLPTCRLGAILASRSPKT